MTQEELKRARRVYGVGTMEACRTKEQKVKHNVILPTKRQIIALWQTRASVAKTKFYDLVQAGKTREARQALQQFETELTGDTEAFKEKCRNMTIVMKQSITADFMSVENKRKDEDMLKDILSKMKTGEHQDAEDKFSCWVSRWLDIQEEHQAAMKGMEDTSPG